MKLEKFGRGNEGHKVTIGAVSVYFSYETLIAFESPATGLVIRANDWGPTTGRHLNAINANKGPRLSGVDFTKKLEALGVVLAGAMANLTNTPGP